MKVELIQATRNPLELIKAAVAITTMTEYSDKIVRRLIKAGAESPLEHIVFTFKVTGVSRALTHQLVRHRIASYTQESQRFVSYANVTDYIVPPFDYLEHAPMIECQNVVAKVVRDCADVYQYLIALGAKPEDARFVLPNAWCTSIYITMNLRSLRNFFKVRLAKTAQWEIRELARKMFDIVQQHIPDALFDLVDLRG